MPWVNLFFKLPETDGYYKVKIRNRNENGDWSQFIEVKDKVRYDFSFYPRWHIEREMPGVKVVEWFNINTRPIKVNLKFFNNIINQNKTDGNI